MEKLLTAVHIDSFRKNPFVNKEREVVAKGPGSGFIRKGKVGDWKNYLDEEMTKVRFWVTCSCEEYFCQFMKQITRLRYELLDHTSMNSIMSVQ